MTEDQHREYYEALVARDSEYEGIFFVGVKTTGVFCRPTCPARKPKRQHCEFFSDAQQALLAGFRPCKRCRPLSHPSASSALVQALVAAVEAQPEKRWSDQDVRARSIDPSTARRQFKKRFGMTFVEYARARRMGLALKQVRGGKKVIDAQHLAGYDSGSGFRDAFSKIMGAPPCKSEQLKLLKASWLDTPLGSMIAIADEESLYLLEFVDRRGLEREVQRLRKHTASAIIPGRSEPIIQIERELAAYFAGKLQNFRTPLKMLGSPFQIAVWEALMEIPTGQCVSYAELAARLGRPTAYRAVARANGANQLALVVPCHRVINTNGELGGYGGGLKRKEWLLAHEKDIANA